MGKDKEYNKRILVVPEEETAGHKKKSKTSSKSTIEKRSKHKHDYEDVIIEDGIGSAINRKYYWGKRCKICGRVDDKGWYKDGATSALIKKKEKVTLKSGDVYTFDVFYSPQEIRKLFPGTAILKYSYQNHEVKYEEV